MTTKRVSFNVDSDTYDKFKEIAKIKYFRSASAHLQWLIAQHIEQEKRNGN